MVKGINRICISAYTEHEFDKVKKMILKISPSTKIIRFYDVLSEISLLEQCDYIFTVGGDGSVAWLINTFYETFGNVKKLKPIIPVIRPESIGYLKQLDYEEKKFFSGMLNILNGNFTVQERTILKTNISGHHYVAVNEIFLYCAPQIGEFTVYIKHDNSHYHPMITTMADGVMVVTPIGSTGWALSYHGQVCINEEALEVVFAGGIHSSANFTVPRRPIKITIDLKNMSVTEETVQAYEKTRQKLGLEKDKNPTNTLGIAYGPRVIIDGKIVSFDTTEIEIDSSFSIPFVFLHQETIVDKARKLTQQHSIK